MALPRILFLDDVDADAEIAERSLRRAGLEFEARVVHEGSQFDAALAEFAPDLIVADYSLPQLDGRTAIAIARRRFPDVPLIFLSGTIGEEEAIETLKAGATDYVLKDRIARLAPAVRRALQEAAEKRERRRAEEELRRSEDLHRTVIAALGEGVLVVSPEGAIIASNPRAERILGSVGLERMARTATGEPWDARGEDGSEIPPEQQPIRAVLRTGEPRFDVLLAARGADDTEVWLSVSCQPLGRDGTTLPRAVVASFADVTERRLLEDQLLQSQKLESIGLLAGGIAHDFNNLMTVVTGYGEILLGRLGKGEPTRPYVEEILQAGRRAAALTRQLLAFSRKQVLQPRPLDLNLVLQGIEPMLRRLIREDIHLSFHPGANLGTVKADPGQIEQVLMNLAVNARDAMPEGGRLTFETAPQVLDETYARRHAGVKPGSFVMLSVSDTGVGMDAETQARIFEPFFTTKATGHGTGLGLSTVYGIVAQSGGNIWVYSEPGKGTTFRIYLPRIEGSAEEDRPLSADPEAVRGSETLLLVEDEDLLRPLIRTVLESYGYTVYDAHGGAEALEIFAAHGDRIELMITDMVMPGMSGRELAARAAELRPHLPVLYLSGYTDQIVSDSGLLAPGQAFLAKPFTSAELARKVREVLTRPASEGRQAAP